MDDIFPSIFVDCEPEGDPWFMGATWLGHKPKRNLNVSKAAANKRVSYIAAARLKDNL